MTIKMEIQREGKAVEVGVYYDEESEFINHFATSQNGAYQLTPEEKAFCLNLALERLRKEHDERN